MKRTGQLHHIAQNIPGIQNPFRVYEFSMLNYQDAKRFAQYWGGTLARTVDHKFHVTLNY